MLGRQQHDLQKTAQQQSHGGDGQRAEQACRDDLPGQQPRQNRRDEKRQAVEAHKYAGGDQQVTGQPEKQGVQQRWPAALQRDGDQRQRRQQKRVYAAYAHIHQHHVLHQHQQQRTQAVQYPLSHHSASRHSRSFPAVTPPRRNPSRYTGPSGYPAHSGASAPHSGPARRRRCVPPPRSRWAARRGSSRPVRR